MKKSILTSLITVSAWYAGAQITLTAADKPVNNTTFFYYDANEPNPPFSFNKTGTSNTWDFTTLTPVPGADDTSFAMDPSQVTGGAFFPSATFCSWEAGDKTKGFIQVTSSGASYLGMFGDAFSTGNDIPIVFAQPAQTITFPFTLGHSKNLTNTIDYRTSGSAVGQPTIDSARLKSTSYYNSEVIASGNMIVPAGTYPALLEIKRTSSIDTLWIKGTVTGGQWIIAPNFPKNSPTDSTYTWYTSDVFYQYAHVIYKNGAVTDVHYYKSKTVNPVNGVQRTNANTFRIYPNPANDVLHVENGSVQVTGIRVTNLTGQQLHVNLLPNGDVDTSPLPSGVFLLHLTTNSNENSVLKFVKL